MTPQEQTAATHGTYACPVLRMLFFFKEIITTEAFGGDEK